MFGTVSEEDRDYPPQCPPNSCLEKANRLRNRKLIYHSFFLRSSFRQWSIKGTFTGPSILTLPLWSTMYLSFLNPLLAIGAVVAYFVAKFVTHFFSTRRAFRHLPGPCPSSLIWGDEWLLYHSTPGVHYIRWHRQHGKVLRFTGAFGVCFFFRFIDLLPVA